MQSSKASPLIAAGAAGFVLGYAASTCMRSYQSQADSKPSEAAEQPRLDTSQEYSFRRDFTHTISEGSEANDSVPNTPRGSVASEGATMKMALLVEDAPDSDALKRGRTAVLVAHAVLQQYKKLFRKRDPTRGVWDRDGGVKEVFGGDQEQLASCRKAAKAEGVPTFQVNDPQSGKGVLCIGPAAADTLSMIVGELAALE